MGSLNAVILQLRTIFILIKHWFFCVIASMTGQPPLKDLSSETILITGAASGLGKGMAQRLAKLGATLILWDIDEEHNNRLAEELNQKTNSNRVYAMKCDLSKRENIYECAQKVIYLERSFDKYSKRCFI